jgi:hypothetical protein
MKANEFDKKFEEGKDDELVKSQQNDGFVKSSPAPSGTDGLFSRPSRISPNISIGPKLEDPNKSRRG